MTRNTSSENSGPHPPPPPVLLIVIDPGPLVIETLLPAERVARLKPVPLPIKTCPLVGDDETPVPPLVIPRGVESVRALIVGLVNVLLVRVCVESVSTIVFRPAPVPTVKRSSSLSHTTEPSPVWAVLAEEGRTTVPAPMFNEPLLIVGLVRVLLVRVSVVARPTSVSVVVGRVRVPVLVIEEMLGVDKVGEFAKTSAPEPVSSVTAKAKLDELGTPRNAATPVPRPLIPVDTGRLVQLERFPEDGVPRFGDIKVGELANTKAPEPVSSVTAAASWEDVVVRVLLARLMVLLVRVSVVARPIKVSVEVGRVSVPVFTIEAILGVVRVGEVPNTKAPEPVSSVTAAAI